MTKQELSEMLHATGCPVNEGISDLDNGKKFPRIDYWEIAWDDVMASGDNYEDKITWQVSFYSRTPRNEKLIMLRDMMRKKGLHPTILHEFITDDKIWHYKNAGFLLEKIKGSNLITLEGTGHELHVDDWKSIIDGIEKHIND